MEYKTEFTILLPEKLTTALDIDEDTLFETYMVVFICPRRKRGRYSKRRTTRGKAKAV